VTVTLVVPDRSRLTPSGGDRYDATVAEHWARRGTPIETKAVPGAWPDPTGEDLRRLAAVLRTRSAVAGSEPGAVLLDGLVGCAAPDVVAGCAAERPTAILVHSLLSEGAGAVGRRARELEAREARSLAAAHAVIVTSQWARLKVERRYGLTATVAPPGVERAPAAEGTGDPPQLLTLAAVTALKNHALLLAAFEPLVHLPWVAVLAGPQPDPALARSLRTDAARRGLADRVTWPGPLLGDQLDRTWHATDLLVHPSRSETYGMVVSEAHARGIPTIVGARTGAEETLRGRDLPVSQHPRSAAVLPGAAVDTGAATHLTRTLEEWLTDPGLRADWRRAALHRRSELPGWDRTVELIAAALASVSGPSH
jgi:glycosyltransferase involved in cell wall biosynthesis